MRSCTEIARRVLDRESKAGLKPDNHARVICTSATSTELAVVYLHGLTASPMESGNTPELIAKHLGAPVVLGRLPGHGVDYAVAGISDRDWKQAAVETFTLARELGERVILCGTSLGASLWLWLASHQPSDLAALVLWSPGIRPHDEDALSRACTSAEPIKLDRRSTPHERYWSERVSPAAYVSLRRFMLAEMTPEIFRRVTVPVFLGYFEGPNGRDQTASVPAMRAMFEELGTPKALKEQRAYADGAHVLASPWRSAAHATVVNDSIRFLDRVLNSQPETP
jgi:pimeloyl-ACP methyl ester carboxylesterase